MITTIYKCDRCGKEQNTPEQMWEIGVVYRHINYASTTSDKYPYQKQLWCRACLETLGALPQKEGAPEVAKLSFEELVRGLVSEEIAQQLEAK